MSEIEKNNIPLLLHFALVVAVLTLVLSTQHLYPGSVIVKTSMCVFLAACAWRAQWRLLGIALLFSAAGDAFLGVDGERLFIPGLASFLVTHVLYAVIFRQVSRVTPVTPSAGRKLLQWLIPLFALGYSVVLWPRLGTLVLPVIAYIVAIVIMAALSLRVQHPIVPLGAILFMISDSLIALSRFLWSADWVGPLIWITYAAAQLLITYGLVVRTRRSQTLV